MFFCAMWKLSGCIFVRFYFSIRLFCWVMFIFMNADKRRCMNILSYWNVWCLKKIQNWTHYTQLRNFYFDKLSGDFSYNEFPKRYWVSTSKFNLFNFTRTTASATLWCWETSLKRAEHYFFLFTSRCVCSSYTTHCPRVILLLLVEKLLAYTNPFLWDAFLAWTSIILSMETSMLKMVLKLSSMILLVTWGYCSSIS